MRKIKKGDQVIVLCGKDKGKRGSVTEFEGDERVLVDGVNLVKTHQKANPNKGLSGGIIEKGLPIHVSNVALYNVVTQKSDRVGFRLLADGRKVRFFKATNDVVDI